MIELYTFKRNGYTLVVIETRDFQPLDIERVKNLYPDVDGTMGVAIAHAPSINSAIAMKLGSWYRNRCQWQAVYEPTFSGLLIGDAFGGSGKVVGEVIPARLPCLECFRDTGEDCPVKAGAKYPYCEKHYARSPHRSGSRRKKV